MERPFAKCCADITAAQPRRLNSPLAFMPTKVRGYVRRARDRGRPMRISTRAGDDAGRCYAPVWPESAAEALNPRGRPQRSCGPVSEHTNRWVAQAVVVGCVGSEL